MASPIELRVYLSRTHDWDAALQQFRCAALRIPSTSVTALLCDDVALQPSAYEISRADGLVRIPGRTEPPAELILSMEIGSSLTTRKIAGLASGAGALLIAVVTGVAQFMTAVIPAQLQAESARQELAARLQLSSACEKQDASASTSTDSHMPGANAPQPSTSSVTTQGPYSPVLQGGGSITFNAGK